MHVLHLLSAGRLHSHPSGCERAVQALLWAQRASPEITADVHALSRGVPVRVQLVALLDALRLAPGSVLHTHGHAANLLGRLARCVGAPMARLVSSAYLPEDAGWRGSCAQFFDALSGYLSSVCTVTDPFYALQFPPGVRVEYIPHALPLIPVPSPALRAQARGAYGFAPEQFVVGTLHRLLPAKGIAEVLEAARFAVRWDRRDVTFVLAGEGPLQGLVEAAALELPNLRYLGYVEAPDTYLAGLDAFVHPVRRDGLSLALLEAMRAASPIIATRAGATPAVLRDGFEAMLIEPQDPMALAAAILRLADDRPYAQTLGEKARERYLAEFQLERQHRQFLSVYGG